MPEVRRFAARLWFDPAPTALVLAAVVAGVSILGDVVPGAVALPAAALAYACGAHAGTRPGIAGTAALLAALQVQAGFSEFPNLELVFLTLAPWWVGSELRKRRRLVAQLEERTRELETERDAFARLSVRRERARIAGELHDIVAHHLAVIVIQAGAGRMAASGSTDEARERFRSIRVSGGQALADMARLVDVLHADKGGAGSAGRLRLLLDRAAAGGLRLDVTSLDPELRLPAEVEESAYRVVQEGLTNAMKHAPGAAVSVRVAASGDTLEVEVENRPGGAARSTLAETGAGLGLEGMRERIESLGGSLDAGPAPGGGWRLSARLPMAVRPLTPAR
jgi:signal transduction histidine kinase